MDEQQYYQAHTHTHKYIYMYVCVCMYVCMYVYIPNKETTSSARDLEKPARGIERSGSLCEICTPAPIGFISSRENAHGKAFDVKRVVFRIQREALFICLELIEEMLIRDEKNQRNQQFFQRLAILSIHLLVYGQSSSRISPRLSTLPPAPGRSGWCNPRRTTL